MYTHFHSIDSSNPRTWFMFSFVYVISDFIHQHLIVSEYRSSASLGRCIPRDFILFDVLVNGIVSLMSMSDLSLLAYKNARDFFFVCVRRMHCCIYFWLHWVFIAAHVLCVIIESRGYSIVVVCRRLIVVPSLVEHRL